MTAFARVQGEGDWGSAVCELRSVNHRYLETVVRLPENLHALEAPIRDYIRRYAKRGKVEFHLRYQPSETNGNGIIVNSSLAKQICSANETIAKMVTDNASTNVAPVQTMDVLRWPGVLQIKELDLEAIEDAVLKLLDKGLKDLVEARLREGEAIKKTFHERLDVMKDEIAKVRKHMPEILAAQRERLAARFNEVEMELDSGRLEQEILLFSQKIDVAEELDRTDTHISEVRRVLKKGGVAGRRLDFLMQELNREANTLGSKAADVDTSHASVELKVLIEQMREQVQNVE